QVQVTRLGHGDPDAAGPQSPRRAGLPADLWQGSATADLLDPIRQTPARLPAMTALMLRLLTAQLPPPIPGPADAPADTDSGADTGAGPAAVESGQLLLARADRLLDMGALDRAQALLMATGAGDPQIFRRLFDIALLEGDESRACDIMNTTPGIAPSFAARIFCLAQTGDWAAAAISLSGAERLRLISADQALLMQHFLDDTFVDSGEVLEPSQPMTPLNFRIFEAIGQRAVSSCGLRSRSSLERSSSSWALSRRSSRSSWVASNCSSKASISASRASAWASISASMDSAWASISASMASMSASRDSSMASASASMTASIKARAYVGAVDSVN
ncbi:MAG: hypothetical protein ABGW82_14050, partial [Paracoccus sp. (in: a-proteobacteria)]